MCAVAALGPLGGDVIRYRVAPGLRDQLIVSDGVSTAVTAPLLLVAAVLIRRGSPAGSLLALGPALTCWYMLTGILVGQDRTGRYPGNDEIFLPLFMGVLVLASAVAVGAWKALPRERVAFDRPTRALVGGLLLALVLFDVFARYLPAWLAVAGGGGPQGYSTGPAAWWVMAVEDLMFVLPAAAVTGVGLLRHSSWAASAAFAVSGVLALVAVAVTGRAWATTLPGNEGSSMQAALTVSAAGLASTVPALVCWLAVLRTGARAWGHPQLPTAFVPVPRTSCDELRRQG